MSPEITEVVVVCKGGETIEEFCRYLWTQVTGPEHVLKATGNHNAVTITMERDK